MSYDFAIFEKHGRVDLDAVRSWISARPNWRVPDDTQAVYENENTGVYFLLDLDSSAAGGPESPPMTAAVNLYRPSFFIQEIEPEITALVGAFDLAVDDLQADGPAGLYDPATFRDSWLEANAVTHRRFGADDTAAARLPTEQLTALWTWNYHSPTLQDSAGDDVFVPRIMVFRVSGVVATIVTWADGIPTLFPKVDGVLVYRDSLAPRRLFRRGKDVTFLPWLALATLIGAHSTPRSDGGLTYMPAVPPSDVISGLRRLPPSPRPPIVGVPFDQVHDLAPDGVGTRGV